MQWSPIEFLNLPNTKVKNHTVVNTGSGVYVFGGYDGNVHQRSLSHIDVANKLFTTHLTSGDQPHGRNGHTATLYQNNIYIIGGWNSLNSSTTKEIYALHLDTFTWEKIHPNGEQVVPCNMHTANLYEDKIIVFRGGDGTNYLHDLHSYDIGNNSWNSVKSSGIMPSPRANHASSISDSVLYIFGGWNGYDRLQDLYSLDLKKFVWVKIQTFTCPKPRAGMSLVRFNDGLLLFGGSGESSESYSDLWYFEIAKSNWVQVVTATSPSSRAGHSFTQISKREFLLFGGSSGASFSSQNFVLDTNPPPEVPSLYISKELNFMNFLNSPEFSDFKFIVEGKMFYAHKIIITRLSEYFQQMFNFGMRETIEAEIEIKGIRFSVFRILMKFLYSGVAEVGAGTEGQEMSIEYLLEVLQAADRFLIMPIVRKCEVLLWKRVDRQNVEEILNAVENLASTEIKRYCHWYIQTIE